MFIECKSWILLIQKKPFCKFVNVIDKWWQLHIKSIFKKTKSYEKQKINEKSMGWNYTINSTQELYDIVQNNIFVVLLKLKCEKTIKIINKNYINPTNILVWLYGQKKENL